MRKITSVLLLAALLTLVGCTGQPTTPTSGVSVTNDLSTARMQPGGTVMLRTSINNYWDNELTNMYAKLTRSYGDLEYSPTEPFYVGDVQANPNATQRAQWTISIKRSANIGATFDNSVKVCFDYNQQAWHEIIIASSFDVETAPRSGADSGPLEIVFTGLDDPFIKNELVAGQVPLSVTIKNNYNGYLGDINTIQSSVANITQVIMRIYDSNGDTFSIIPRYTNPGNPMTTHHAVPAEFWCISNQNVDNASPYTIDPGNDVWFSTGEYYNCSINDLQMFGTDAFLQTRLNITSLNVDELIEKVEVELTYTYCVESSSFSIEVFGQG